MFILSWVTHTKFLCSNSLPRRMCRDVGSSCVYQLIAMYLCALVGNIVVHTGKSFWKAVSWPEECTMIQILRKHISNLGC
jgi:hypothetical protein